MPSLISSASSNSSFPALKYSISCGFNPGIGWPAAGAPPRTPGSRATNADCDEILTWNASTAMPALTTIADVGGESRPIMAVARAMKLLVSMVSPLGSQVSAHHPARSWPPASLRRFSSPIARISCRRASKRRGLGRVGRKQLHGCGDRKFAITSRMRKKTEETIREERNVRVGKLSSKTTHLPEDGGSALSDRSVRIDRIHHLTHRGRRWTDILRQGQTIQQLVSMTTTPEAVR